MNITSDIITAILRTLGKDVFFNKLLYRVFIKLNSATEGNDYRRSLAMSITSDMILALIETIGEEEFFNELDYLVSYTLNSDNAKEEK